MDKLKGVASVFDSLEELYIGDSKPFEANILKQFKCLKHVYVWKKEWFDELSVWLCSHCPDMTCHKFEPLSWTDLWSMNEDMYSLSTD